MHKFRSRGFTLIELLVVIAIIGILSAVVLASLNTARQKGQNAAVQSDLSTIQTQAEIQYGNLGNSYNTGTAINNAGTCSTLTTAGSLMADTSIQNAVKGAKGAAGADGYCVINATGYMFAFPLSGNTGAWCIDSTGYASDKSKAGTTYANVAATYTSATAACN